MKVCILGAGGYVGGHVATQCLARGHTVTGVARSVRSWQRMKSLGVTPCEGNILKAESLHAAMRGADAVITCVGIIRPRGKNTYENIHVGGTRHAIEAATACGVKRFILISAQGAREYAPTAYHRTKWQGEQALIKSGLTYTIFRPSILYGPDDAFTNMLARTLKLAPFMPVFGSGAARLQPLAVAELATCVEQSLSLPASEGKIYPAGGPKAYSFNEILEIIMKATGVSRHIAHIPLAVAIPTVGLLQTLVPCLPVTLEQVSLLQEDNVCNIEDLCRDFSVSLTPFEDGIKVFLRPRHPALA